ncbi:hypothetical protein Hanom_Chr07g00650891 [Helianthus anomalus]
MPLFFLNHLLSDPKRVKIVYKWPLTLSLSWSGGSQTEIRLVFIAARSFCNCKHLIIFLIEQTFINRATGLIACKGFTKDPCLLTFVLGQQTSRFMTPLCATKHKHLRRITNPNTVIQKPKLSHPR